MNSAMNTTEHWRVFQSLVGKHRVFVSLLLSGAFIIASYLLFGLPTYDTNDDVGMAMISAGVGFVDRPDEHLMFMHFCLGKLLNLLYSALPAVPWYAVLQLAFLALAMTVIWSIIFERIRSAKLALMLCTVLALSLCVRPLQILQFTTTAALVATAGSLLLLFGLEGPLKRSVIWRFILPSLALIALAAIIRERSAYLILALSAIALTTRHLFSFNWKKLLVGWTWLLLAAALAWGISVSNDLYYDRGEWKGFYTLERITMPMRDYERYQIGNPHMVARLKQVNWSPLDFLLFQNWYVLDERVFSLDAFQEIVKDLPLLPISVEMGDIHKAITEVLFNLTFLPATVTLFCFAWLARRERLASLSSLSYLLGIAGVISITLVFLKLPERVYAPILSFSVLFFALYFSPSAYGHFLASFREQKTLIRRLIVATLLIPVVLAGIYYRYRDFDTSQKSASLREEIRQLAPTKDDLYVVWACALPFEAIRPFDNLHDYFDNFNLVWVAAYNRCPFVVERLKEWGVDDLLSQFDRKNVHLISIRDTNIKLMRWILNSCGKPARFERIHQATDESQLQAFDVIYDPPEPLADNSPDCPVLKKSDLLLYPVNDVQVVMKDIVLKENQSSDFDTFVIGSKRPKLTFKPEQAIDPNKLSHFGIQMAVSPWSFFNRFVDLSFKMSDGKVKRESILLLPDGKMHSYSFDLNAFHFTGDSRIVAVEIETRFRRADAPENSFDMKCIGFTRSSGQIASSLKESHN